MTTTAAGADGTDSIFRIKTVGFKGKSVPILMQNLNGPCPLLAISKRPRTASAPPNRLADMRSATLATLVGPRSACVPDAHLFSGAGNALLLSQKITVHQDLAYIDFRQLVYLIGDYLVTVNPPHPDPAMQANQQQQIADALTVLPKLGRGLDVNLRFQKCTDFEYTDELSVLDMLGINLVHGWLCDPQDTRTASVIKDLSYNQLICMLVDADDAAQPAQAAEQADPKRSAHAQYSTPAAWAMLPSVVSWNVFGRNPDAGYAQGGLQTDLQSGDAAGAAANGQAANDNKHAEARTDTEKAADLASRSERLAKAHIVEEFLQDTASQLTYFGLAALHSGVSEGELCVFFRNNHFCTMCRYDGELFLLVTDVGFYDQPDIVWEKLADVSGDNAFVNAHFSVYDPKKVPSSNAPMSVPSSKAAGAGGHEIVSLDTVQSALSAIASVPGNIIKDAGAALGAHSAPPSSAEALGTGAGAGGFGGGVGGARGATTEQEDADMALAMSLQLEWEEEERKVEQRRREQHNHQQQQQMSRQPHATAPQLAATAAGSKVTTGGAAARQRAGAGGGIAAEQMALYQLAQQERHAEARTRERQQQQQPASSQAHGTSAAQAQPTADYRRRLEEARSAKKQSKKDNCVLQ